MEVRHLEIRTGNVLQALRGVQKFIDDHAAELGDVATSGAKQKLDAQVAALAAHSENQSGSTLEMRGATQKQYSMRDVLRRDHMAPIASIARADLPSTPELRPLRMPRGRPTTENLHSAATGMAQAAEPYADVFIAAGRPVDFIARLRAAADVMVGAVDTRTEKRGTRRGATRGLKGVAGDAMRTVQVLNTFLKGVLKDRPDLLAAWNSVRRPPTKTSKAGTGKAGAEPDAPVSPDAPDAPVAPGELLLPDDPELTAVVHA